MTVWCVLASGPSMSREIADSVRGRCKVVAVSNCYELAPWADVLVSADGAWWKANPRALEFQGLKYGLMPDFAPVKGVEKFDAPSGINSGLLGLLVAAKLGAKKILLAGFDMKGSHYFGPHPAPLKNTSDVRFEAFKRQFVHYRPRKVEVINCTPGSGLKTFPMGDLETCLAKSQASTV